MAIQTETLKNFIDGEFVDPAGGETEPILSPARHVMVSLA
jgi:hypothetical protein